MFFCVLFISTTNISDFEIKYLDNEINSYLYNIPTIVENSQQNTILENLFYNNKTLKKNEVETGSDQSNYKSFGDNDSIDKQCDQYTCETDKLLLTPNQDSKGLFQSTESVNFIDQDYLMDISLNTIVENTLNDTPQYLNDDLNVKDFSHINTTERNELMTNNDYFFTQTDTFSDATLLNPMESIPAVQENEALTEQLIFDCTDKHINFNNQSIDDIGIETDLFKDIDIDRYVNWEPDEFDDKKSFFEEFDFEYNYDNYVVDSCFIEHDTDKYANFYEKECKEHSAINSKKSLYTDDLTANNTKIRKLKDDCIVLDYKTTKSLSSDDSNIEIFNILIENRKELRALRDKFFVCVRKKSYGDPIFNNLSKDIKYYNIRQQTGVYPLWFKSFANETFKLLVDDIETLSLPANTKNLFFGWVEFLSEVAKFIANFKNHFHLKQYNRRDVISNLTLTESISNEMILRFKLEKIYFFFEKIIQKHKNDKFYDSKSIRILLQILYNFQRFETNLKQYGKKITVLKDFHKINFNN